ncbi:50S ribosome-binding GTPase [Cyanobacterium aponinum FACHB-4101]|uniref:FeoB small GTPase domain-containing protein n=1 Tax=Cyanobacterium aponinum TaxID=379064 RepID=UPI001680FE53|nr:FeoB small GTPase domain-containing protein [Cyanobacterium aponinum]MBD2395902.1 50S ribosome-binding GTPase [Cyanobacterium aponinum FACHB-4101]
MNCHQCQSTTCHSHSKNNWFTSLFKKKKTQTIERETTGKIALVGMPNVGKSVLFNALTGIYVDISNYPGTTVEISHGKFQINNDYFSIIDTPGMYSLLPITEEERVARDLLLQDSLSLAIHVVEAKNLARMLTLTFQLIEAGFPTLLAVNMIDEAEKLKIKIDPLTLEDELGIPVIKMSAATGFGVDQLKRRILSYVS